MTNLPEGFIPWGGGKNPVPGMIVDVIFHNGDRQDGETSHYWSWRHIGTEDDCNIVGYRVWPIPDTASKGE